VAGVLPWPLSIRAVHPIRIAPVGIRAKENSMNNRSIIAALLSIVAVTACQTDQQILAGEQATAIETATRRGQFELTCPAAVGMVLSSNMLQPVAWRGLERAEYTVGVEGCGRKVTYIVVCQLGSPSCFAVSGRNDVTPR